jgi:hypothetical protein
MADTNIFGYVRGGAIPSYAEGDSRQVHVNARGEQIVALGLPPLTQLVSAGQSWWCSTTTAAAPVTAIPTTAALIGLWNGEALAGGVKSYVLDSAFVTIVAATAAIEALSLLVNVSTQAVATAIANTQTVRALRANKPYSGTGRVAVGITLDATNGVAANWMPVGTSSSPVNTTQVGQTMEYDFKGGIILPPGGQVAFTVLSGAATASSLQIGFRWHEMYLPAV